MSEYDLVLIHYSIYILGDYFLPRPWSLAIEGYSGAVVQIIQDEHRNCYQMQAKMKQLGVVAVFGSLATKIASQVYVSDDFSDIAYISCLPGYLSESILSRRPKQHSQRTMDLVYRGRELPKNLGSHGRLKFEIGQKFRQISQAFGLKTDIETAETTRIYGESWYSFLENGRSTLCVEGGSSIFDLDGSIQQTIENLASNPNDLALQAAVEEKLAEAEGRIVHRTITPRCLEAIALRTAIVAYPGDFRNVLLPKVHYIPLDPDGHNIYEVVEQVRDFAALTEFTDKAFSEIAQNRSLHFSTYISVFDVIASTVFEQ